MFMYPGEKFPNAVPHFFTKPTEEDSKFNYEDPNFVPKIYVMEYGVIV